MQEEDSRMHIRHCIRYEFELGHTASEARANICEALGEDATTRATVQRWFKNFNLRNKPRPAKTESIDLNELKRYVDSYPIDTRTLALLMDCTHATLKRNLTQMGYYYNTLHHRWFKNLPNKV